MNLEPKPISKAGIARAIEKAERYRFLNQPWAAESICLDVLEVDPENQAALVDLLLALTDQFREGISGGVARAREVLPRIRDDYRRAYYAGIICERRGVAQLTSGTPGAGFAAYDWLREAMEWYERAEAIRPAGNDDAILRWNTCARALERNSHLVRDEDAVYEPTLGE
ncbi:MAG: hypothetical protein H7Z74_06275 [Anaerolineae bacterium]|nr:hypothetical protein [Gemmatimonadaceae bacterium]